jgi:methyltransferase (TIGR00027 family)
LRASGFRDHEPSAWVAKGLLIYLTAAAQQQLFAGIDELACAGSRLALEEGRPMDPQAFRAKVAEAEAASTDDRAQWRRLVYNEQIAPAADWFAGRGRSATATALVDYLRSVDREPPDGEVEVVNMVASITLVEAVKGEN